MVTREAVQTAVRVLEILFVLAIMLQAAAGLSYVVMNRRLQRLLDSEMHAEQGAIERRMHDLEVRSAAETTRAQDAEAHAAAAAADADKVRKEYAQLQRALEQERRTRPPEPPPPPPRELSEDEMQILVSRLSDAPPMQVDIAVSANAKDGDALAHQLVATLSEAGWSIGPTTTSLNSNGQHGIRLLLPEWDVAPPGASVLAKSLREFGLDVTSVSGEEKRTGVMVISIGPRH